VLGKSGNTVFDRDSTEIIQGVFNLKFLLLFTKATSLSNTVSIYLKNDYPLILEYSVGVLGTLKFVLSNILP
jgi:Proliferating cell nuclear antigen, C-terminal domain